MSTHPRPATPEVPRRCADCVSAPALQGPAFAPAFNAHLPIRGVFTYMATNLPADRSSKLKIQGYAYIMAFLLYSNRYPTGRDKDDGEFRARVISAAQSRALR